MSSSRVITPDTWEGYPPETVLADLIHETYQPIQTIKGFTQALLNANLTDKQRVESLNSILEESLYLESIMQAANTYNRKLREQ